MTLTADESMASVAEADTYAAARQWADWAALLTADKEATLRVGNAYIVGAYRWPGSNVTSYTQVQPWPRWGAFDVEHRLYDPNAIPTVIKSAVIEAARLALTIPLLGGDIDKPVTREKIGPLEFVYATSSVAMDRDNRLAFVNLLMKMTRAVGGSGSITLKRS